jgi:hypothetical protein
MLLVDLTLFSDLDFRFCEPELQNSMMVDVVKTATRQQQVLPAKG